MKTVTQLAQTELEERQLSILKRDLKAFVCDELSRIFKDTSNLSDDELLVECERMDMAYQKLFSLFRRMHAVIDPSSWEILQTVTAYMSSVSLKNYCADDELSDDDDDTEYEEDDDDDEYYSK